MDDSNYPALYVAANQASMKAQKFFFHALFWNLAALVVAAIISVLNQPNVFFAFAQIIALFTSLSCTIYIGIQQPQKIWYGTRAITESVKTITWRFMMRAEPYNSPDNVATTRLADDLQSILRENKDFAKYALYRVNTPQITPVMRTKRSLSLNKRKAFYATERITEQLGWYQRKAAFNEKRSKHYFLTLVIVNIIALGLAVARITYPSQPYWPTDIFIATAGSIISWVQAKRFQELSASYTLTAHEIGFVQTKLPRNNDEKDFSSFVGDAENAFSREHTQWLARCDH